jgi:hypothetical protein
MFREISMILGMVMSVVNGPSYIGVQTGDISLNWQNGDDTEILYFLPVKNEYEKARFDIYSDSDWVDVYYEANPNLRSVTINGGNTINFVLEIHPSSIPNGQNRAEIKIDAIKPNDSLVYETKKITLVLNKNVIPPPTASPEAQNSSGPVPVPPYSWVPPGSPVSVPVSNPIAGPTATPPYQMMPTPWMSVSPQVIEGPSIPGQATDEEVRNNVFVRFWLFLRGIFD